MRNLSQNSSSGFWKHQITTSAEKKEANHRKNLISTTKGYIKNLKTTIKKPVTKSIHLSLQRADPQQNGQGGGYMPGNLEEE
jgi:hypothetical protein